MIFTLDQINTIWQGKTATLDKIYLCDDNYMYKGVIGGSLTRILTGNLDDYKAELRKQQLAVEQEEYQQQLTVELLVEQVSVLNTKSKIKQVEVDFGDVGVADLVWNVNDVDVVIGSKIIPSVAYESPTGEDLDKLRMEGLNVIAGNVSLGRFELYITPINGGTLSDKFKINYLVN